MCIFCNIIKGEIPSFKIYEDEYTYAFLDISDDIEGHTLVVPKVHCENILDVPQETLAKVMETVQKISKHYVEICGYNGVNILNNNNECAEQSVFHLHFHIMPRKNNDGKKVYPNLTKLNSDMAALCERVKVD